MRIQIQSIHFPTSESLNEIIEKKLTRSFDVFPFIQEAKVYLKLEGRGPSAEKCMEVDIPVPHGKLFAKSEANTFEKGLDQVIQKLKKQLEKYKESV